MRYIILTFFLTVAVLFSAAAFAKTEKTPVNAIKPDLQTMDYDVYAGGFHVVSSELVVDLSAKTRYLLSLSAATHGLLGRLAPWTGVFETKGWYDAAKAAPQPEQHKSDTTFRDKKEVVKFDYNKNGSFKQYSIYNDKKEGPQPPQPELSDNTTDVLSATLRVMNHASQTGKCEGTDTIFDGARSYQLTFVSEGEEDMKGSDLNVYSGPAFKCTVEVKPLKGKWSEKPRGWMSIQEQGRERGTMPTVWLAQMAPGETAVPVKIRVKTEYGTLFMHLTHYKGAGTSLDLKD